MLTLISLVSTFLVEPTWALTVYSYPDQTHDGPVAFESRKECLKELARDYSDSLTLPDSLRDISEAVKPTSQCDMIEDTDGLEVYRTPLARLRKFERYNTFKIHSFKSGTNTLTFSTTIGGHEIRVQGHVIFGEISEDESEYASDGRKIGCYFGLPPNQLFRFKHEVERAMKANPKLTRENFYQKMENMEVPCSSHLPKEVAKNFYPLVITVNGKHRIRPEWVNNYCDS